MGYDDLRQSVARADLIDQHIAPNSRILDFGAYKGVIAGRLAELGHSVVAVSPELPKIAGVVAIRKRLTAAELAEMGHYNVALCLSVLHHLPDWRDYVAALESIADVVFYEHAVADEDDKRVAGRPAFRALIQREVTGTVIGHHPGKDTGYPRPLLYRGTP